MGVLTVASWTGPPALGCLRAVDGRHDWQWAPVEPRRRLTAWIRRLGLSCGHCGRAPSDPYAQPAPHEWRNNA